MAEYDHQTALHYAAYRPPLHRQILELALAPAERFARGLDVGCGTGRSTHALAKYCDRVTGIDPSPEMIAAARRTKAVRFTTRVGTDETYGIVTFAGSLFYQDAATALRTITPLCPAGATVLVYDFNVMLEPVFALLGKPMPTGDYNHRKNFAGVSDGAMTTTGLEETERVFSCTPDELAHLLLSVRAWRENAFAGTTHAELAEQLWEQDFRRPRHLLTAKVFYTRYRIG